MENELNIQVDYYTAQIKWYLKVPKDWDYNEDLGFGVDDQEVNITFEYEVDKFSTDYDDYYGKTIDFDWHITDVTVDGSDDEETAKHYKELLERGFYIDENELESLEELDERIYEYHDFHKDD